MATQFAFGSVATPIFLAVIYLARSLLFEEVIADESGLRWRGAFGPWESARWGEITDFYLAKSEQIPTIETTHGKFKLSVFLTYRAALQAIIAERATNVPIREWELQKFRAAKPFSERFVYWSKTQKWQMPLVSALFVAACVGRIASPSPDRKTNIAFHYFLSPWPIAVLFVLFFGTIGVLCCLAPLLLWRERNAAYQRRHEFIGISARGMLWSDGETEIRAAWNEVRAISPVRASRLSEYYRVETQNGDFIVWHSLDRLELWLRLVRQFAPQIAPEPVTASIALGGEASTWSGGKIGQGARVFHFRTSGTRALLWVLSFLTPVLPVPNLLFRAMRTPDDPPLASLSIFVWLAIAAALLATVLCWIFFARAAIWADETALEWRLPFLPTRRVEWREIEAIGREESGVFIQVVGQKRRLWLGFAPVRREELLQLIAARATKATGRFS